MSERDKTRELIDGQIPAGSQEGKILRRLMAGRSITPLEAMRELGCYRLGARIHRLRQKGYNIITTMKEATDHDGSVCRFASYRLEDTQERGQTCSSEF